MSGDSSIILVTGGSGLVGQAIKTVVEQEKQDGKNETWIFCASKDGDLRYVLILRRRYVIILIY